MKNLTNRQTEAILSLVSTNSVSLASKACGTPVRTLYRWLEDPHFKGALDSHASAIFEDSQRFLRKASLEAAHELVQISKSKKVPANVRLHALTLILELGTMSMEKENLKPFAEEYRAQSTRQYAMPQGLAATLEKLIGEDPREPQAPPVSRKLAAADSDGQVIDHLDAAG